MTDVAVSIDFIYLSPDMIERPVVLPSTLPKTSEEMKERRTNGVAATCRRCGRRVAVFEDREYEGDEYGYLFDELRETCPRKEVNHYSDVEEANIAFEAEFGIEFTDFMEQLVPMLKRALALQAMTGGELRQLVQELKSILSSPPTA